MDFSKTDKLTERNKENSFLDVDWIITELINYGHEKLALAAETSMSDVPNSPQRSGSSCSSHALQRSTSLKNVTKVKKKVNINLIYVVCMSFGDLLICPLLNFEVRILCNICFLLTEKRNFLLAKKTFDQ